MRRFLLSALALALFATPGLAEAKKNKDGATRVYVRVLDENGGPIPTAVIRHPDEQDRHRVNSVDGTWDEEVLYMPDGTELVFEPGLMLTLEVSAPSFETKVVQYQVRRRRNRFDVELVALQIEESEIEAPKIQFGTDNPRDTTTAPPAN